MTDVLVVGARKDSLGDAIAKELTLTPGPTHFDVKTAGVSGDEDYYCDVRRFTDCEAIVRAESWQHIICTVGINKPDNIFTGTFNMSMAEQLTSNCVGVMNLLNYWMMRHGPDDAGMFVHQFVAVSSNSAHIPRSQSIGYCASKAALSQAIRCAARALPPDVVAWALEPGWIAGTPMSNEVSERLRPGVDIMRGGAATNTLDLAKFVRWGLDSTDPSALNGMTFKLDGGER